MPYPDNLLISEIKKVLEKNFVWVFLVPQFILHGLSEQ
jgi:hypothetical protein